MFSVGDKVTVRGTPSKQRGEVVYMEGKHYIVMLDTGRIDEFLEDELEFTYAFEVGDKVRGNIASNFKYNKTDEDYTGYVTGKYKDCIILDDIHFVEAKYFDLVEEKEEEPLELKLYELFDYYLEKDNQEDVFSTYYGNYICFNKNAIIIDNGEDITKAFPSDWFYTVICQKLEGNDLKRAKKGLK